MPSEPRLKDVTVAQARAYLVKAIEFSGAAATELGEGRNVGCSQRR